MKRLGALAGIVVLLVILCVGGSMAWFTYQAAAPAAAQVGRLQVEIAYEPDVSDGETEFVVTNVGTLNCHVRVGYTFVYHNADGEELLRDVSGVQLGSGALTASGGEPAAAHRTLTETASGFAYDKNFLLSLREDGGYYVLKPGETLTGHYALTGAQPEQGETLRVSWVAEAVQCGEGPLEDARAYGWDPALA